MNSLGVIASFEPARTMAVRIVLPEQCAEFRFGHVVNALDGVLATRDEEPKYAGSRHRGRQHRSLDCGAFGQLSGHRLDTIPRHPLLYYRMLTVWRGGAP